MRKMNIYAYIGNTLQATYGDAFTSHTCGGANAGCWFTTSLGSTLKAPGVLGVQPTSYKIIYLHTALADKAEIQEEAAE